ncbi:MAG: hypothetical protein ACYC27_22290 [Armatimonadota bacterium]
MGNRKRKPGNATPSNQRTPQITEPTAADIARKARSLSIASPSSAGQTGGDSLGLKTTTAMKGVNSFTPNQRSTPSMTASSVDEGSANSLIEDIQFQVETIRTDVGSIEDKVIERLKDKAVNEVLKIIIWPVIIAAIILYLTYIQSLNGVRSEIDRCVSTAIREAKYDIQDNIDRKIKDIWNAIDKKANLPITNQSSSRPQNNSEVTKKP